MSLLLLLLLLLLPAGLESRRLDHSIRHQSV